MDPSDFRVINPLTPEEQVQYGMTTLNIASLPLRAVNLIVGKLVEQVAKTHPAAEAALVKLGKIIEQSPPAQKWSTFKQKLEFSLNRYEIPESEVSYFLESFDHLALFGATAGAGTCVKAFANSAQRIAALVKGRNSGYPVLGNIHFKPETLIQNSGHFAIGTPAEVFLNYQLVQGSHNSALIYLHFIKKTSTLIGTVPYSASRAGITALINFGLSTGAKRLFLQFDPMNPKFHAFVAKYFPSRGKHYFNFQFLRENERYGPYPVFELTPLVAAPSSSLLRMARTALGSQAAQSSTFFSKNSNDVEEDTFEQWLERNINSRVAELHLRPYRPSSQEVQAEQGLEDNISPQPVELPLRPYRPSSQEDQAINIALGVQKVFEQLGHLTGVQAAAQDISEYIRCAKIIASNPLSAPLQISQLLIRKPLANVVNLREQIKALSLQTQPLLGALGIITLAITIVSVVDELKEVRKAAKLILKKPDQSFKILFKLSTSTVKNTAQLAVNLFRKPGKTLEGLAKSLVKTPIYSFKRIGKWLKLRKKKKKRVDEVERPVDPKALAHAIACCYRTAGNKWRINKSIEAYGKALVHDWQTFNRESMPLLPFISFIRSELEKEHFTHVHQLCPTTHPLEAVPTKEVMMETKALVEETVKLQETRLVLEQQAEQLENSTASLAASAAENREAIEKMDAILDQKAFLAAQLKSAMSLPLAVENKAENSEPSGLALQPIAHAIQFVETEVKDNRAVSDKIKGTVETLIKETGHIQKQVDDQKKQLERLEQIFKKAGIL